MINIILGDWYLAVWLMIEWTMIEWLINEDGCLTDNWMFYYSLVYG